MKTTTVLGFGFFAGAIVGGGLTFLEVAPAIAAVLLKPLEWLVQGFRPFPSESPANIIIALPLMFIYWGCLGALGGLLLRAACRVFRRRGRTEPEVLHPGSQGE